MFENSIRSNSELIFPRKTYICLSCAAIFQCNRNCVIWLKVKLLIFHHLIDTLISIGEKKRTADYDYTEYVINQNCFCPFSSRRRFFLVWGDFRLDIWLLPESGKQHLHYTQSLFEGAFGASKKDALPEDCGRRTNIKDFFAGGYVAATYPPAKKSLIADLLA